MQVFIKRTQLSEFSTSTNPHQIFSFFQTMVINVSCSIAGIAKDHGTSESVRTGFLLDNKIRKRSGIFTSMKQETGSD